MEWFFDPERSHLYTEDVKTAVRDIRQIESVLTPVPAALVDILKIFKPAILLEGDRIFNDGEFYRQSILGHYLKLPLKLRRLIDAVPNSSNPLHIPPSLIVRHRGSPFPTIIPYKDGGQLVLIDPINHRILSVLCCGFFLLDAYDKINVFASPIFLLILKTILVYAPNRDFKNKMEDLLFSPDWEKLFLSLNLADKSLLKKSDDLAFNMIAFSFYHEISHSLLGHFRNEFSQKEDRFGDKAENVEDMRKMREEKEADLSAINLFKNLIDVPIDAGDDCYGPQYAHAPISFFKIMQFAGDIQYLRYGALRRSLPKTHPSLDERISLVPEEFTAMNEVCTNDYAALVRGIEVAKKNFNKLDFRKLFETEQSFYNFSL